jgi:hypothetical protein
LVRDRDGDAVAYFLSIIIFPLLQFFFRGQHAESIHGADRVPGRLSAREIDS